MGRVVKLPSKSEKENRQTFVFQPCLDFLDTPTVIYDVPIPFIALVLEKESIFRSRKRKQLFSKLPSASVAQNYLPPHKLLW